MWVLDTDISIELTRGRRPDVAQRVASVVPGNLSTTIVNVAELRYGAVGSREAAATLANLEDFLQPLMILPLDLDAVLRFAEIKLYLKRRGMMIGPMDLLVAAIVLVNDATIVTNNVREFSRVPDLRIENWLARRA